MNDQDLRDCFAMFAMCGFIMRNDTWRPSDAWEVADDMIEARKKKESGIVAVKRSSTKKEK